MSCAEVGGAGSPEYTVLFGWVCPPLFRDDDPHFLFCFRRHFLFCSRTYCPLSDV